MNLIERLQLRLHAALALTHELNFLVLGNCLMSFKLFSTHQKFRDVTSTLVPQTFACITVQLHETSVRVCRHQTFSFLPLPRFYMYM